MTFADWRNRKRICSRCVTITQHTRRRQRSCGDTGGLLAPERKPARSRFRPTMSSRPLARARSEKKSRCMPFTRIEGSPGCRVEDVAAANAAGTLLRTANRRRRFSPGRHGTSKQRARQGSDTVTSPQRMLLRPEPIRQISFSPLVQINRRRHRASVHYRRIPFGRRKQPWEHRRSIFKKLSHLLPNSPSEFADPIKQRKQHITSPTRKRGGFQNDYPTSIFTRSRVGL